MSTLTLSLAPVVELSHAVGRLLHRVGSFFSARATTIEEDMQRLYSMARTYDSVSPSLAKELREFANHAADLRDYS